MDEWAAIRARALDCRRAAEPKPTAHPVLARIIEDALRLSRLRLVVAPLHGSFGAQTLGRLDRYGRFVYVAEWLTLPVAFETIGHELGHYHLHDDERIDVLPAGGRDGRRILLGYSPRERVEIEADVFAAEFLCPTPWLIEAMRRGATPSTIATELRIPLRLVLKQAAHAAFVVPFQRAHSDAKPPLDADQARSIAGHVPRVVIEGGPGTGKSVCLAARFDRLVAQDVSTASILVLGTSDASAGRLRRLIDTPRLETPPWIGTFRAFGAEIIRKWPHVIGRSDAVRVLDEASTLDLLRTTLRGAQRDVASTTTLLRSLRLRKEGRAGPQVDAGTVDAYEAALRAADAVDHADLLWKSVEILETNSDAASAFARRTRHILVDDYQDIDLGALALLKTLGREATSITAAANPLFSIYRHNGALAANGAHFLANFGGERRRLERNYRATPGASEVLSDITRGTPILASAALATRRRRPSLTFFAAENEHAEYCAVADRIRLARRDGVAYRDQAVLCRTHTGVRAAAAALAAQAVPVVHLGDLLDRSEIVALIDLASAPQGKALSANAWERVALHLFETKKVGSDQRETNVGTAVSLMAAKHFLDVVEEAEARGDVSDAALRERMRRLRSTAQETAYRRSSAALRAIDGVQILTVHAAMGSEFDVVHLPHAVEGVFPLNLPAKGRAQHAHHVEHEFEIFLAAASRARFSVSLTAAKRRGWQRQQISRFVVGDLVQARPSRRPGLGVASAAVNKIPLPQQLRAYRPAADVVESS